MDLKPPAYLEQRLELFPISTRLQDNRLTIAGLNLEALAREHGTPLYVYDRQTLDAAVRRYQQALGADYPGASGITYAGKAFLCTAIAQWTQEHGLWLDCTGAGELAIAAVAGVPRDHILVHGVSKSLEDLQTALAQAGTIVVDNLAELGRILAVVASGGVPAGGLPELWLRLRPGLAVATHAYTQTGQDDSKFGVSPVEFLQGVRMCRNAGLSLTGLHFHQGSHFHDPAPVGPALDTALDLVIEAQSTLGWTPQALSPGGGWGLPYSESDLPHQPAESYVNFVAERLEQGCRQRDLPLPRLYLEPGRSLVAQAGVALYRVQAVKQTPHRRWLLLDGGMADNPRPALYDAHYSALPVARPERPSAGVAWLAGPYCESGDILISGLDMPEILPGELLAVPVSGAYQLSMGSNYNGARRPAVLWLDPKRASLIQRRETLADLTRRDLPLPARQGA